MEFIKTLDIFKRFQNIFKKFEFAEKVKIFKKFSVYMVVRFSFLTTWNYTIYVRGLAVLSARLFTILDMPVFPRFFKVLLHNVWLFIPYPHPPVWLLNFFTNKLIIPNIIYLLFSASPLADHWAYTRYFRFHNLSAPYLIQPAKRALSGALCPLGQIVLKFHVEEVFPPSFH